VQFLIEIADDGSHPPPDDMDWNVALAVQMVTHWIRTGIGDQAMARKVTRLFGKRRWPEAIRLWNRHCPECSVTIREFDVTKESEEHAIKPCCNDVPTLGAAERFARFERWRPMPDRFPTSVVARLFFPERST
jgi:hypothetical protein